MKKIKLLIQLALLCIIGLSTSQVLAQTITPTNKDWSHGDTHVYTVSNNTDGSGPTDCGWETDVTSAGYTVNNDTDWSGSAPFTINNMDGTGTVTFAVIDDGPQNDQDGALVTSTESQFKTGSGGTGIRRYQQQTAGRSDDHHHRITMTFSKPQRAFYFEMIDLLDIYEAGNPQFDYDISVVSGGVTTKVWQLHGLGVNVSDSRSLYDGGGTSQGSLTVGNNIETGVGFVNNASRIKSIIIDVKLDYGNPSGIGSDNFGLDNFRFPSIVTLPVEFAGFDATLTDESTVLLEWATASEENNSHFEIERSADGLIWSYIGQVAGAGNSTTTLHYEFTDNLTLEDRDNTHLFYRLKQIDFDGKYDFSTIRSVSPSPHVSEGLKVYPNPAKPNAALTIGYHEPIWDARVYDVHGQLVLHEQYKDNPIKYVDLDISELRAGIMYFIRVNGTVSGATGKFVVN